MEPLVSVLIPVYNVEQYLPRCLDSIVAQTYVNLEVILVNDGSSDRSGEICDRYAEQDARFRVIHQKNAGVAAARNKALEAVSGEYIMFVDADDYISPDTVRVLYDRIVFDGSDMAVGKHTDLYEDGTSNDAFCRWMEDAVISGEMCLEKMGGPRRFAVVPWGKLYRRNLLNGIIYPMLSCGEDNWVFPLILKKCNKISICNRLLYYYYQRECSIVHVNNPRAQRDNLEANLHMAHFLLENGCIQAANAWYRYSIQNAWRYIDKQNGVLLFDAYFSKAEKRILLSNQDLKTKIQWIAIHHPTLYEWIQYVKRYRCNEKE